jgi:hypothetical protein
MARGRVPCAGRVGLAVCRAKSTRRIMGSLKQSCPKNSAVPLHDNLGENYRDNLGESLSSARVCVGLATISADVRRRDEAQWHLGGRAEAVSGSGRRGQRAHNSLRFGRFRCNQPRCSDRCKIAADAPLLWRTILEQPEVEEFLPSCRRRWLHSYDLRDFTFGYE